MELIRKRFRLRIYGETRVVTWLNISDKLIYMLLSSWVNVFIQLIQAKFSRHKMKHKRGNLGIHPTHAWWNIHIAFPTVMKISAKKVHNCLDKLNRYTHVFRHPDHAYRKYWNNIYLTHTTNLKNHWIKFPFYLSTCWLRNSIMECCRYGTFSCGILNICRMWIIWFQKLYIIIYSTSYLAFIHRLHTFITPIEILFSNSVNSIGKSNMVENI